EALAKQSHFRAGEATGWGDGYEWSKVRELFEQLLVEGVIDRGGERAGAGERVMRAQPSPLPPSQCPLPPSWAEAEKITRDLTGRGVEFGHLELFIPIFRIAHIALDADGRQVGEANVFPRELRME